MLRDKAWHNAITVDVLSDVLSWLRVRGTVTRRSELSAPWGIRYPKTEGFAFMAVEQGRCVLQVNDLPPIELEAGDIVMLGPTVKSSLRDRARRRTVPYTRVLEEAVILDEGSDNRYPSLSYGGGGRVTAIRGWGLRFESYERHPLLALLPPFIHLTYAQRSALPWLESSLRFVIHETQTGGEGSDMVIVRLVELIFVQIVRAWLEAQPEGQAGWLGGLRDKSIRKALRLIHQQPEQPWTVQSLAKAVGMSRSSFSARFTALVGTSALRYLTEVRMHLAANILRSDAHISLAQLAVEVGYDTESSFGRAFKRYFQVSPGVFRRQRMQAPHDRAS